MRNSKFPPIWQGGAGKALVLVGVITLLSLALRTWRLDYQPLWWDEGISIFLAHQDTAAILDDRARDIHPPLYFLVLRTWIQFVGPSAWATRFLSVWFSVLTIPLLYVMGRRLFGHQSGWLAGVILAVAPFHIHHSQETRMYTLVPFLAMLSTYLLARLLTPRPTARPSARAKGTSFDPDSAALHGNQPQDRLFAYAQGKPASSRLWLPYLLSITLALYTHYYAVFIPIFHGVILLILRRRSINLLRQWFAAQFVALLLYLPWIAFAGSRLLSSAAGKVTSEGDPVWAPLAFAARYATTIVVGYDLAVPVVATVWLMILALLGLLIGLRRHRPGMTIALLWLAVPVAGGWALNLWFPFGAFPRLLGFAAPALYLLTGVGLAGLAHRSNWLMLSTGLLTAALLFPAWQRYYTVPRWPDDDYRPLVRYLQTQTRSDDVIICDFPWQTGYLLSYLAGPAPRIFIPSLQKWSYDSDRMDQDLSMLLESHQRLWYPAYQSLGGTRGRNIEAFLTREAYPAEDKWYGHTRLLLYGSAASMSMAETRLEANFADQATLLNYATEHERTGAGDVLPVSLRWQARSRFNKRYKVFVHLLSADHRVVAQRDAEPHAGAFPTTDWPPGATIVDNYGLLLPADLPDGEYVIELGMYDPVTGDRLPVMAGGKMVDDKVQLAEPIRVGIHYRAEDAKQ